MRRTDSWIAPIYLSPNSTLPTAQLFPAPLTSETKCAVSKKEPSGPRSIELRTPSSMSMGTHLALSVGLPPLLASRVSKKSELRASAYCG